METARIDFDELQQQLSKAVQGIVEVTDAVGEIASKIRSAKNSSSTGEQWARTWGETLPKKATAKMLGVSVTYLNKLISNGVINVAPDGRVVVRSAADWANQNTHKEDTKPKKRWRV